MLACALANTVKQVGESFEYSNPSPGSFNQISYDASGMNCVPGDAFYLAAKKRLGLLDVTLTSVQYFFLAGLYEVCRLRPTNAWVHYSQACSRLQFILSHRNVRDDSLDTEFHVLERLYFSCCRTERYVCLVQDICKSCHMLKVSQRPSRRARPSTSGYYQLTLSSRVSKSPFLDLIPRQCE